MNLHAFALDPLLDAVGQQDPKGSIGIHHVLGVADPHGHLFTVALGDRLQRRRGIKGPSPRLANRQPQPDARRLEIDDATEAVGSLVVLESTLEPEAAIAAADRRPRRVDAAASDRRSRPGRSRAARWMSTIRTYTSLMEAVDAGWLGELLDAQDRAAE